MKKNIKKILLVTTVSAVAVGVITGIKFYIDSTNTIEVNSVATLNTGYWDNPSTSTGFVSSSNTQSISYDSSKTITNIFVQQGQEIKAGDPLLSYDTTSLQATVDDNQLSVEKAQNAITLAQHELEKLVNTTPIPDSTPVPTQEPVPTTDPIPLPLPSTPKKDENGYYPYILSLSQAEKNIQSYKIFYISVPSEEGVEIAAPQFGPEENNNWKEERIQTEYGTACFYWIQYSYTDGTTNAYSQNDAQIYINDTQSIPSSSLFIAGTKENPYTFNLILDDNSANPVIYGKLFNDISEEQIYLQFNLYQKQEDDSIDLYASWKIQSNQFASLQSIQDGDTYSLLSFTKQDQQYEENDDSDNNEETDDTQIIDGYTEAELAKAIRDKKLELRSLDLDYRKAQITLKENKELLSDGIVRAKHSGIVQKCADIANLPQDGSAIIEVVGGSGYYITGFISELLLDSVKIGDEVGAYSWSSGNSCTATIQNIDTFPASDNYYNGSGNPNVSYYSFEAYTEDTASLTPGDYLELTLDNSSINPNQSIWLSKAYVKKEGKKYYVMKEENGLLVKQYVKVGRIAWGDNMEILDGITETDYIAFAYSKNAKEGTKTQNVDQSSEVMYE